MSNNKPVFNLIVNHISILIERDTVILFAESEMGSTLLSGFATATRLGDVIIGHGSREAGTYKPFACVVIDTKKHAPKSNAVTDNSNAPK